jgi:hypothetical protein
MTKEQKLGGILAIVGALMGFIGHFSIFLNWYYIGMAAESAEPGCEILLKWIHPAMADLGMVGATLFAVSAYGFFTKRKWAFLLSVVAIVLALQGAWFINVPFMAAGLPPVYFTIFWPYLILYFLITRMVGRVSWGRTLLGFIAGMAWVFCMMNGIASLSRIITIGAPFFTLVQRMHWVAMLGWGVVSVSLLIDPREWTRVVGISAGLLEVVVGIPLAYLTGQELGRFSLFSLAPISCLILVVLFVWPGVWEKLTGIQEQEAPQPELEPAAVMR